jgi:hypothetical protein
MHLSAHYATLLQNHMKLLRHRFVPANNAATADRTRANMGFEPLQPSPNNLLGSFNLPVDWGAQEANSWMMLPFDPAIEEPFEQAMAQNLLELDVGQDFGTFWDYLP